jgi:hypothetical protein
LVSDRSLALAEILSRSFWKAASDPGAELFSAGIWGGPLEMLSAAPTMEE